MQGLRLRQVFIIASLCLPHVTADETTSVSREHSFLKKFAGTWTCKSDCRMGEGKPPMKTTATSTNRMIGDFWITNEIVSTGGGAKVTAIQTIGYDDEKKKFVGTWIDSMFNHMWQYEGTLNEDGTTLTLEAEGPNLMTGEGTTEFRDIYEFRSDDHIAARSLAKDANGEWIEFVKGDSKRVKPPKTP